MYAMTDVALASPLATSDVAMKYYSISNQYRTVQYDYDRLDRTLQYMI